MINLVGVFWGTDDKKCFLWVLIGFVVWGPKSYFWGFKTKNTKNKIFYQPSFLELYDDS